MGSKLLIFLQESMSMLCVPQVRSESKRNHTHISDFASKITEIRAPTISMPLTTREKILLVSYQTKGCKLKVCKTQKSKGGDKGFMWKDFK